jgi:hypothetical protein
VNDLNAVEVEEEEEGEEVEAVGSTTDAIQDLHHDETTLRAVTTEDLPRDVMSTHTFLLQGATIARMIEDVQSQDQYHVPLPATPLLPFHPLVVDAIVTPPNLENDADHQVPQDHHLDEVTGREGGILQVVVKIDHDPIHV